MLQTFLQKIYTCQYGGTRTIENTTDTVYKLNTVSETINEMSKNYKDESNEEDTENKEKFIQTLLDKLDKIKDNILYEELIDEENGLVYEIYDILLKKNSITKDDLVKLLENRNEYILGFDDFDTNFKVEESVNIVVRLINETYKIFNVNNLWKHKIQENKKVIASQLGGVSRAISSVAKSINKKEAGFEEEIKEIQILCKQRDIEILDIKIEKAKTGRYIINIYKAVCQEDEECRIDELEYILSKVLKAEIVLQKNMCAVKNEQNLCKQVYMSKDKFMIQVGLAYEKKDGSLVSGDYNAQMKLDDGKYLIALSDGMGSGSEARKSSQIAIKMLCRMLGSGFDKDTSLELINSSMYINSKEDTYATLDVAILDLYAGNMEFMKNGACPTFIKNKRSVKVVKSVSLPAGILDKVDLVVYDKDLNDGDIIIMCTDGILESNVEYENKEVWVKNLLEEMETDNVQKIANILLAQAVDNGVGKAKDDMTVIAVKVKKNI